MAEMKLTDEQQLDLEDILKMGFAALAMYVESGGRSARLNTINALYSGAYGTLSKICDSQSRLFSRSFVSFNKGGGTTSPIESYIHQIVLMYNTQPRHAEDTSLVLIVENRDDGMGGLKAYINANETKNQDTQKERGEVFRRTQLKAAQLRKEGRYDLILEAMKYVREKTIYYPQPNNPLNIP